MRFVTPLTIFILSVASPWLQAMTLLTPLEHQKTIALKPKENIVVKLPSDPSTGYMWFLDELGGDSRILKMTQDWRFTPRSQDLVRSQGDTTWRFSTQAEGTVTLRFIYRKPWQGPEVAPLDVREFQLIVGTGK